MCVVTGVRSVGTLGDWLFGFGRDLRYEIGEVVWVVNMISKEILLSLCDYGKRFCRDRFSV